MNSRIRAKLLPLAITALLASAPAFAQVTSSAISGRVLDSSGQPVAGATVTIVHEPSGTTKVTTTGPDGRYAAQGLRVGGPFDVKVSKDGQVAAEQDNVYLQLAQESAINLVVPAGPSAKMNTWFQDQGKKNCSNRRLKASHIDTTHRNASTAIIRACFDRRGMAVSRVSTW